MPRSPTLGIRWLAFIVLLAAASTAWAGEDGGTRIGVLDMKVIFDRYSKSIAYDKEIKRLEGEVDAEQRKREEEIRRLEAELQELEPGTPEFTDKRIDLRNLKVDLEYWLREQGARLRRKLIDFTEEILRDIRRTSREIAEVKGLDLVINYSSGTSDDDLPADERGIPVVLFAKAEMDVTKEVLDLLNRSEEEKAAMAAEGPPGGEGSPPEEEAPPGTGGE